MFRESSRLALLAIALPFTPQAALAQILAPGNADLSGVVATRDLDYRSEVEYPNQEDRLDVFMPEGAREFP